METPTSSASASDAPKQGKKIFIPALGSLGDLLPYLALAKRLQKLGFQIKLGSHLRYKETATVNGTILFSKVSFRYLSHELRQHSLLVHIRCLFFRQRFLSHVFVDLLSTPCNCAFVTTCLYTSSNEVYFSC